MTYTIYQINNDGTGSWVSGCAGGASPQEALASCASRLDEPSIDPSATFLVARVGGNPNGKQVLFRLLQRTDYAAIPVEL